MLFWSRYFFLQWPTVLGTKSFTSSVLVLREVIFELPQTIRSPKKKFMSSSMDVVLWCTKFAKIEITRLENLMWPPSPPWDYLWIWCKFFGTLSFQHKLVATSSHQHQNLIFFYPPAMPTIKRCANRPVWWSTGVITKTTKS